MFSLVSMSLTNIFKSDNMIIILANIIFFMTIHTLFFRYIASNQFASVLRDKADIFEVYLKYDPELARKYKILKSSDSVKRIANLAHLEEMKRNKINFLSMLIWTGIPITLVSLIMLIFIVMLFREKNGSLPWDKSDTVLLSFVVFAYITEIISYYIIINKYQFYGDQELCSDIYQTLRSNINVKPISKKGKQYYDILAKMSNEISDKYGPLDSAGIEVIRTYFRENKQKINKLMPEVSEEFFVVYIEENMTKISNLVDSETLLDLR